MINALVNADVDQSMPGRLTWADCTTSWPFMTTTMEAQLIIRSSSSWQLQCNGRAADNNHYLYSSGGNYVISPLLFNHTKENTMLHTPIQAKIMTHIRSKMWTLDNGISRDTPTLTKQTTEAFDTRVGTDDLILITKILSLNGSRIRRSYQDARKKFPWFTFPQFSIWVTIGGWSCVEGQGSVCAGVGVSKITCHHYWRPAGKQMSQTRCLSSRQIKAKSTDKYRRSVSRNTVNKAPGWTAYGWQLTAGRLYTFHHWSRGRGGQGGQLIWATLI